MQQYRNLGGTSPIRAFHCEADSITVEFEPGGRYLYTVASTGAKEIRAMQALAEQGRGLCAFISRNVKRRYAARLP